MIYFFNILVKYTITDFKVWIYLNTNQKIILFCTFIYVYSFLYLSLSFVLITNQFFVLCSFCPLSFIVEWMNLYVEHFLFLNWTWLYIFYNICTACCLMHVFNVIYIYALFFLNIFQNLLEIISIFADDLK